MNDPRRAEQEDHTEALLMQSSCKTMPPSCLVLRKTITLKQFRQIPRKLHAETGNKGQDPRQRYVIWDMIRGSNLGKGSSTG